MLALTAFLSVRTGEAQEEVVEEVVPEQALHGHEEAAETFFYASLALLGVTLFGLLRAPFGKFARYGALFGGAGVAVLGTRVGMTGGELVYRHGAATAYQNGPAQPREKDEEREGALLATRENHLLVRSAPFGELEIPPSIREEHEEIHAALVKAMRRPAGVGAVAREIAALLDPHFAREEQIALPPLGLLRPLTARGQTKIERLRTAAFMADSLRRELPAMRNEHVAIGAAVQRLLTVAQQAKDAETERLAVRLGMHARQEEEVLYPAAVMAGTVARNRLRNDAAF